MSYFLLSSEKIKGNNYEAAHRTGNSRVHIDGLDIKIIKEIFHDPNVTSTTIANKYHQALSTIQRRRAKLENTLIKKSYTLEISKLGWRLADLSISVQKGRARITARELVISKRNNVITASLRIGDPAVDIMASVFYKDSQELHTLIESIKAMPHITHVEWSEIIEVTESNVSYMIDRVLASGTS